jgi:hypothetical protein
LKNTSITAQIKKARQLLEDHGYGVSDRCPSYPSPSKRYRESDLRLAFRAARDIQFNSWNETPTMKFPSYNDYLKTLQP